MHRSPRVAFAWLVAVVVAIATVRVVGGDLATVHQRARALGPNVRVLLAEHDLSLGKSLDAADVRVVTRPASTVPTDALHSTNDVRARVLVVGLFRDDVVRAVDLAPIARNGLDGVIPVGRRAVHIVLKDGFRPPVGAVVDVLAAADPSAAPSPLVNTHGAATVALGALVIAVDDAADSASGSGSAVTVLVSAAEAAEVAYAATTGQIVLALAPPEAACCTS